MKNLHPSSHEAFRFLIYPPCFTSTMLHPIVSNAIRLCIILTFLKICYSVTGRDKITVITETANFIIEWFDLLPYQSLIVWLEFDIIIIIIIILGRVRVRVRLLGFDSFSSLLLIWLLGRFLRHFNPRRLFNAKPSLYIYIYIYICIFVCIFVGFSIFNFIPSF